MDWYPLWNSLRIVALSHWAAAQRNPDYSAGESEFHLAKVLPAAKRLNAALVANIEIA